METPRGDRGVDDATLLYLFGSISLVSGILMICFHRSWGPAFCRLGRSSWRGYRGPFRDRCMTEVNKAFDESKAPARFLMLGIVFVAQSPIIFLMACFW